MLANKKRLMTQMGNQSTASTPMRKIAAHIKKGTFGAVKEVHLWTDRAARYWKQGISRPTTVPIPRQLDYDLWLGPRPYRPYGEGYHPFSWRGWWDFGTGALGDMGCHIFNSVHMALNLDNPISVQAQTSGHNRDSFPTWAIVEYEFGAKRERPGFKLKWYDGGKQPPLSLVPTAQNYNGNGVIIVCEGGTIYCPNEANAEFHWVGGHTIPDIEIEESPGHMAEFFRAIEGGPEPVSNFPRYAGPLTETVLMGNLAIWADGPKVEWDARRMKVKGTNEYDSLIRPEFRDGWDV